VPEAARVVFMGSPEFAVPSLEALAARSHEVVLVVTQPDRPKGRGRRIQPPAVKMAAESLGLPLLQPASIRTEDFRSRLAAARPDFLVVIAFGQLLPSSLLSVPRIAPVNLHASLLPEYRGPAPIQWAIINGEERTGISAMWMDEGMDTGDVLDALEEPIGPEDTAGSLAERLSRTAARLLIRVLDAFRAGTVRRTPQDPVKASRAPLLRKSDGRIDWNLPAERLSAFVRGMSPWPGAFTCLETEPLKILRVLALDSTSGQEPGTLLEAPPGRIHVATPRGILSVLEVQGKSGKRLPAADYLRGHPIPPGSRFD